MDIVVDRRVLPPVRPAVAEGPAAGDGEEAGPMGADQFARGVLLKGGEAVCLCGLFFFFRLFQCQLQRRPGAAPGDAVGRKALRFLEAGDGGGGIGAVDAVGGSGRVAEGVLRPSCTSFMSAFRVFWVSGPAIPSTPRPRDDWYQ